MRRAFRPSPASRSAYSLQPTAYSLRPAFTLTELLIVIAIMAVLAGLIAAAAVNAMRAANRGSITLEIKNMSGAIENLKTEYGLYPPNGMNPDPDSTPASGSPAALVQADFTRMFKKAFQRHQEPPALIAALCGQNLGGSPGWNLEKGMTAAESVYFWLGGFSDDPLHPISGVGGPSFSDATGNNNNTLESIDEVLESRKIRYEFDLARLGPRNDDGTYNDAASAGRFLLYEIDLNNNGNFNDPGEQRRINMWRYTPKGSEQPLVYFDVSRHKPKQYDLWAIDPESAGSPPYVFALKQPRSGVANPVVIDDVVFVDQGKFQILHPGLDDAWGEEFGYMSLLRAQGGWGQAASVDASQANAMVIYPNGPFIGEIADTLTSFTDGTIEDAVEE